MPTRKKAALAGRAAVVKLLSSNNFRFTIQNVKKDKYGCVLADVFVGDVNPTEYLITNRHALPYDGGAKAEPDWDKLDHGLMW